MSIRTRVLLFAGVAFVLLAASGLALSQSAARARELSLRLATVDRQLSIYAGLQPLAWTYLGHLLQAERLGMDSRELLRDHERILHERLQDLQEGLREEQQWKDLPAELNQPQLLEAVFEAERQWAQGVEVVLRPVASEASSSVNTWWELFTTYEQDVNPHLKRAVASERAKQQRLQALLEQNLQRAGQAGRLSPLVALLLVGALTAMLLGPLLRGLRELQTNVQRIHQGQFPAGLPARRHDELGSIAHALDTMAQELRGALREKEQLRQAEAEAAMRDRHQDAETAARDLHRYNAALEQMVRARTTELQSANAQLASSLQRLQAVQAQLILNDRLANMGKVAAGVGHEINNPLAFVISNLNYIHKELQRAHDAPSEEDWKELRTVVAEAKEGAERVRVIVQDLKMLSRPDDVSGGKADLKEVVRAAVKIASHEIRRRARLVEELGEVPPVQGNASRLGQVFLNLLINAAQAIPEGHVEQNEIRIVARQEESGNVLVELHDTGSGIPPENLNRIFEPFFTTKPVGEGTGLGLSLVHSIITALGGTITVESQVGRGTTFRVTLPSAKTH